MHQVYIILGSNIGNRLGYIEKAKFLLAEMVGDIEKESVVYQTEPWGVIDHDPYYNQVILMHTTLKPKNVIEKTLEIEEKMGRVRSGHWSPRTIDIDILLFDEEVIKTKKLTVPHPRMHLRRFVLKPLAEIAPNLIHPVLGKNMHELLEATSDQKEVIILAFDDPTDSI